MRAVIAAGVALLMALIYLLKFVRHPSGFASFGSHSADVAF